MDALRFRFTACFRSHGLAQAFAGPSLGTGALLLGRPMGMWRRPRPQRGTTCHYGIPLDPWAQPGVPHWAPPCLTGHRWGTCCPAAQLTHPGSTPLSGKHLAIPKTSSLHLSEPKKTWYWLRYPNCPPPTFKCMTLHSGCQVLMPTRVPLSGPRWLGYLIRHPMKECSRGHMPFQPSHLPKSEWHAWVHFSG